jgi:hypothetical protein
VRVPGEEPGPGLPNQHAKACPRFQTMHCWCPPATGPGQPHQASCSHFKRPAPAVTHVTHAFIGSYHDWDLTDPDEPNDPIDVVKKYLPVMQQIDPEAWKFSKMAAKMIADAEDAAEVGLLEPCGPGEGYPSVVLKAGEPGVSITPELGDITEEAVHDIFAKLKFPFFGHGLTYHAQEAAIYNRAFQWADKQKPQGYVHAELVLGPVAPVAPAANEFCTCNCAAVSGAIGHAHFCPLGSAGECKK